MSPRFKDELRPHTHTHTHTGLGQPKLSRPLSHPTGEAVVPESAILVSYHTESLAWGLSKSPQASLAGRYQPTRRGWAAATVLGSSHFFPATRQKLKPRQQ